MFSLFYGLWKYLFQKDEYFILILGLDNAGKTTYLEQAKAKFSRQFRTVNPSKITTTVGLNIGKIDLGGVQLNFWDLGGQEDLQSLWDKYYAESHGLIYVIDSSDSERLDESKEAFDKMIVNEALDSVPLLVLANKQDVENRLSVGEVKSVFKESSHRIGRRDCLVCPVSALRGDGVDEGIQWMVQCVKRNVAMRPPCPGDDR